MLVVQALSEVALDKFHCDTIAMGTGGGFRVVDTDEVLVQLGVPSP